MQVLMRFVLCRQRSISRSSNTLQSSELLCPAIFCVLLQPFVLISRSSALTAQRPSSTSSHVGATQQAPAEDAPSPVRPPQFVPTPHLQKCLGHLQWVCFLVA